ncbi:MAG: hypothetical protein JNK81_13185 [Anaerolineales bacterium]|nr:hypothetical protein [Anaerolineales bacterium]
MDKNFYYQQEAKSRQGEISKELKNQHLLKGVKHEPLTEEQVHRLVARIAPVAIIISILIIISAIW